jgi:uncharacterized membrane protein YeaQ/YmgE (transglycosylase-associated protein family)
MAISAEGFLVILLVGLIAGWLAGQIAYGAGFGLFGDRVIGIAGAFVGGWVLPQLGILAGSGIGALIVNSSVGALFLLLIAGFFRGGGEMRGRLLRWRPW